MKPILFLLMALPLAAQAPHATNAKIETLSAAGGIEQQVRRLGANGPVWFGWSVPSVSRMQQGCNMDEVVRRSGPVRLEPPDQTDVLVRAEKGAVTKVRVISPECEIDAGGLTVYWFTDIQPAQSIVYLKPLAESHKGALAAIAMHADAAADRALEEMTAPSQPEKLREQAVFWMGVARGRRGFEFIKRLLESDASDRLRERAVFALYVSKEPGAVDEMISVAKNDRSAHVRGQAYFWLAQKAGKKAAGAIAGAVDNDPDTEVKRRAVFALHQLPNGEGVPKLIEVARSNKNPAVRKQAVFWLGQSKDPRALAFIEDVLAH
jgi:hypothetical protein